MLRNCPLDAQELWFLIMAVDNWMGREPFDQLAEIVDAVGDKLDVICEGGIHRGTHILKALSLGASCSGGRLYLYTLAAADKQVSREH